MAIKVLKIRRNAHRVYFLIILLFVYLEKNDFNTDLHFLIFSLCTEEGHFVCLFQQFIAESSNRLYKYQDEYKPQRDPVFNTLTWSLGD